MSDWEGVNILADGTHSFNTMRAMGSGPVNALQATNVVGLGPQIEDEFRVTRLPNRLDKTSGDHQVTDHRTGGDQVNRSGLID